MLGTALGSRLLAGSGQFKKTDVQESTQLASSKLNKPGLGGSNKDCRDTALEGEILVGTAGGNSCSCPPNSHTHSDGLFILLSTASVPRARDMFLFLFFFLRRHRCVQPSVCKPATGRKHVQDTFAFCLLQVSGY